MRLGISCYPTYGGSGVVASELALRLVAEGHCVHVLSYELPARLHNADVRETSKGNSISRDSSDLDSEPALYFHRVAVHQYPLFDYPPYSLALANEMVQVARRFELDLMHVHYAVPNAVSALLAKQILAPQRLPVVTTLHGTDITLVGNDPSYLETTRWSIANSDAVTAVSEWLELETREQFGGHRGSLDRDIAVIPNFVEAERFAQCQPLLGDEAVLVHVSNFRRVKRVDAVLEAFARLREQRACRLRMVGEGPQRDGAMQRARDLGVADAVDWIGNHPQIEHALDGCALFLLASKQESFGLAALEALAAGLPVVAPRVGGLPDVVTDGVTGRLVAEPAGCDSETADTEASLASAMAEAAAEILGSEETWTGMSHRARADAAERFSVQAVLDQYVAVYNEVLKLRA